MTLETGTNAAVIILSHSDVVQRFAVISAIWRQEARPGHPPVPHRGRGLHRLLDRRAPHDRKRVGNFWLDSFNFYGETEITGWSFNALVLFVNDRSSTRCTAGSRACTGKRRRETR